MKLLNIQAARVAVNEKGESVALPPRVTVELEDEAVAADHPERRYRASVELDANDAQLLAVIGPLVKQPADVLGDDDAKALAKARDEFEATKTRHYDTPAGRGAAQVKLQDDMAPLVERERAANIAAAIKKAKG